MDLKAQQEAKTEHKAHEKFMTKLKSDIFQHPDYATRQKRWNEEVRDVATMGLDDEWLSEAVVF